jgi:hypothetical protein
MHRGELRFGGLVAFHDHSQGCYHSEHPICREVSRCTAKRTSVALAFQKLGSEIGTTGVCFETVRITMGNHNRQGGVSVFYGMKLEMDILGESGYRSVLWDERAERS